MEYLQTIIGLISGGGLVTILNYRLNRRVQKVDFADKAVKFMEEQNDIYIKRIERLEDDVKKLFEFKCEDMTCRKRQPPRL